MNTYIDLPGNVTLDMGIEGAGHGTFAWLEQMSMKFPRLTFELKGAKKAAFNRSRSAGA